MMVGGPKVCEVHVWKVGPTAFPDGFNVSYERKTKGSRMTDSKAF